MTEGIVIRKHKHGIGFAIGVASAVGGAIAALIVLLVFSGVLTDTGLADPPGGGLLAGAAVIPSDKDGGVVHGDGFTVTTIAIGTEAIKYSGGKQIAPVISDIKITKKKDVSNRGDFRVDFKAERASTGTKIAYSDNVKDLYIVKYYGCHNCGGTTFCVYQGKTIYLRIIGKNRAQVGLSGLFKVTYSGQS